MDHSPAYPVFHHPAPPDGPHHGAWPAGVARALDVPDESLWLGLERRAQAEPEAVGLHFLGRAYRWGELHQQAEQLAAALQHLGLAQGERVLLFMQNCPQFITSFHAVLRANAVVVPINPMNKADELGHYIADAGARIAIASSDIAAEMARASQALGAAGLQHLIVLDLADALPTEAADAHAQRLASWPAFWRQWLSERPARPALVPGQLHEWPALLAQASAEHWPLGPLLSHGQDLAILPYTSGTTGAAKGCMHGHASLLHNAMSAGPWLDMGPGDVTLIVVPMFHITGMVMAMLASIRLGCTIVLMPRWDRSLAAQAIAEYGVTHWPNIPTMVIDLLGSPELERFNLRSLRYVGGGGATMPEAIATRLREQFNLEYLEGYGLTETSAPSHCNPRGGARRQCLGIPYMSTRALVVNPDTLEPMPPGEVGEIVVSGPQLFQGYWQQPQATAAAFFLHEGLHYFRTGDLGRVDATGYFTLADRLKRMINASGFKVWPAEVEALLHKHPAVAEVCIIAMRDPYRGESVKAVVVPRPEQRAHTSEQAIIAWCREHMSAYKVPRQVEFAEVLPKSATGKLMWRVLQAQHDAQASSATPPATA
jgi:fatty-acyl-CoA synthase